MNRQSARAVCLDASVLVNLRLPEPYSDKVRAWIANEPGAYTTPFCFYEALNVFKSKWKFQKKITAAEYTTACTSLIVWFGGISRYGFVKDPDLAAPEAFQWVRNVVDTTGLDFSDAYQIYSVTFGYFQHMVGESRTALATTDKELARVAGSHGLLVFDLGNESEPT